MNYQKLFQNKYVKNFTETTPAKNKIKGKILLNHGEYHGSLLIEEVNDKKVKQFIRGFPKIKPFKHVPYNDRLSFKEAVGYEKLDGTCVGLYPLLDYHGNIIETVAKSRQRAVLDKHFQKMLNQCDTSSIIFNNIDCSVIYVELYGMLNQHTIQHKKTYIDLCLIGAVSNDNKTIMLNPDKLKLLSGLICVPLPNEKLTINYKENDKYEINIIDPYFMYSYMTNIDFQDISANIEEYLDDCNTIYKREKDILKYEGIVLQQSYFNSDGEEVIAYYKIKSDSFLRESHRWTYLSVPLAEIRKEVQKIIDENLSLYTDNYDESIVVDQIKEYLLEEYSFDDVNNVKTRKCIVKELHKYIDLVNDVSINHVVDRILLEKGSCDVSELMSYFACHYPLLKHRCKDVYKLFMRKI